jgi:hypothetical protein
MSLESKAITVLISDKSIKMVPLVDAQKAYDTAKKCYDEKQKQVFELQEENKQLEAMVEAANKILVEIMQNSEYQCFYENGLIPCQAQCARKYEEFCKYITDLKGVLQIPRKEKQFVPYDDPETTVFEAADRVRQLIKEGKEAAIQDCEKEPHK